MRVTEGTFRALHLQPILGRRFNPEDDSPGAPLTLILSHDYWQTRFGGDSGVLAQTLRVEGRPREIIGVTPAGFRLMGQNPAFYLPFQFNRAELYVGNFSYQALARLKPGVTIEQANADVSRMIPLAIEKFPGGVTLDILENAQFGADVRPLKRDVVGDVGEVTRTHALLAQRLEGISGVMTVGFAQSTPLDGRFSNDLNQVVMVSENFAREYWDSPTDALGKRISTGLSEGRWRSEKPSGG